MAGVLIWGLSVIALYQVKIFSPLTGLQVATIVNPRSLYYEKWVNNSHTYQLVLDSDDPVVPFFVTDAIVEIWRRIPGASGTPWYREISCLHRTEQFNLEENGRELFTSYGRGLNDLLSRRAILYFANNAFTLKQGPGETVMKQLVEENAADGAENSSRRSFNSYVASVLGLSVSTDNSQGLEWKGAMPWRNLLDVLKEIALTSHVDFEVERTGPRTFSFNTYYPQRGTDRTATLTFSPYLGNMTNIVYVKSRVEEATVVAVLGQGGESARQVIIRQSDAIGDSPWNTIETTRDARNQPDITSLISTGDVALQEVQAHETFTFNTLQTAESQYGRDYDVGDKVRGSYKTIYVVKKITCAKVTISRQAPIENVQMEFANVVD